MSQPEVGLSVFEYGGIPDGGQDAMIEAVAGAREGVATHNIGVDHRVIVGSLIQQGILEPNMPENEVTARLQESNSSGLLVDTLANRDEFIAGAGQDGLYTEEVGSLLRVVSQTNIVQAVVKDALKIRIETLRDSDEHEALLVDGRDLSTTVYAIEGTALRLETFVYCNAVEAAWRKLETAGLDPNTSEGEAFFVDALAKVRSLNKEGRLRSDDPIKPEPINTGYDYWLDKWTAGDTVELLAERGADIGRLGLLDQVKPNNPLLDDMWLPDPDVVVWASLEQIQLFFDTSVFRQAGKAPAAPLTAMNRAAINMYDEAMAGLLVH